MNLNRKKVTLKKCSIGLIFILILTLSGCSTETGSNKTETPSVSKETKISTKISELVSLHNTFLESALVNDDNLAYQTVLNAFSLKSEYFSPLEEDENVYFAKYVENQKEMFAILLYFDDLGYLTQIQIGVPFASFNNGIDGAYECLKILSYGMLSAVNPQDSPNEILDLWQSISLAEGTIYKTENIEYCAYSTEDMFIFNIYL